jgi:hypothetical protein
MARTVRDANLKTRTARLRLPIRTEPYWRGLEKGFALGYRRRIRGGTWLGRRRQADGGYLEHRRVSCSLRLIHGLPAAPLVSLEVFSHGVGHCERTLPCIVPFLSADGVAVLDYGSAPLMISKMVPALGTTPVGAISEILI